MSILSSPRSSKEERGSDSHKKGPQQHWLQLLIGLVVILTTNFLVIGGIIFTIHLLLIPWLVAYIVGIVSLLAVAAVKYLEKLFLHCLFVLFISFTHIIFWILVNQVRASIRQTED